MGESAVVLLLLGAVFGPSVASAQGLAIDHKEVSCLVAGKFPRLTACFAPPSRLARARVYFKADGTPHWYYVDMTSDAPCFRGVLPKPTLGIKRVNYYVEALDKSFAEAQTPEYDPEVVKSESECRKGLLAPILDKASVLVGSAAGAPLIPTGFLGAGIAGAGLGAGAVAGIVAGGAAVVGGAVVAGGGGDNGSPPPSTSAGGPTTTTPPATTSPGAPTTTTLPGTPTTTTTTLPGTPTTTTTLPGTPTTTTTTMPLPCGTDTVAPTVAITDPISGAQLVGLSAPITAVASDNLGGSQVREVRFYYQETGSSSLVFIGAVTAPTPNSPPPVTATVQWTFPLCSVTANPSFKLLVQAEDFCGNVGTPADFLPVNLRRPTCFQEGQTAEAAPTAAWSSELTVPGGHGQVVLNGTQAAFPGPFRSALDLTARRGANRLEAVLVQGEGKPGLWRFDLAGIAPGSLRVVSGEVALVTGDAIVFRLKGRPGERVVFTFRSESSGRGLR